MWAAIVASLALLALREKAERYKEHKNNAAPYLMKTAYFVVMVAVEWRLLSGQTWLPQLLGGSSTSASALFAPAQPEDGLALFYQVQLGYHVHSLVFAFRIGANPEMHLHHVVTLVLIIASSLHGYERIGSVVFLVHDVPDIFGSFIKAALKEKSTGMALASYVGLLLSWGYFRLYVLLQLIFLIYESEAVAYREKLAFNGMLGTLVALHHYWYLQFFVMGARMALSKHLPKDTSEVHVRGLAPARGPVAGGKLAQD